MMKFLRKHQRSLLIVISVMTIASFSFFGTFGTFSANDKVVDKEIAQAIDGTPIMQRDVQSMVRFLSFGNADVVERDLLATGMASILAERYFDAIQDEFQLRLDKIKHYKTYVHPQAPFLNAEEVWKRFIPQMMLHLADLKRDEASPQTFALYCRLYLDQVAFPPDILKRVLSYHQQQYGWIQEDPMMTEERLSLFGFQSLEEWFGEEFMRRACFFFINTALMAQEKGYTISSEEARADLLQNALCHLQSYGQKQDATYQEANEFLQHQLRVSGIDEAGAVKIWKRVMLFRRMFDDVGQAIFLDPLTYEQFAAYAGERASIDLYQLPEKLRLRDFRSLLKFQFYLDAVAPKNRGSYAKLPSQFSSVAELEKRFPELVQSRFHLEVAKATREEIAQRVTLKETWDFEMSDAGWTSLIKEFPILEKNNPSDRESRFHALEEVDSDLRLKIDRYARSQIVAAHPEWIEEALQKAPLEKIHVGIRSRGAVYPFLNVDDSAVLLTHLQQGQVGEALPIFTSDQEVFYRITLLNKPEKKEIMTYEEALQDDLLGELLDRQLEEAYTAVRKRDPELFQLKEGGWRPFKEVRDLVGMKVFSDFLKGITEQTVDLSYYSSHRLSFFMEEAKKSVKDKGDDSPFVKSTGDPLKDQWLLVKRSATIKRSDPTALSKEELFTANEGQWSSISTPPNGDVAFFRLVSKEASQEVIETQVNEGQRMLSMDAKRFLMHQVLERIDQK